MTKKISDKIEELEEWKARKEIEDGIKAGITKRIIAVCMTATTAILAACYEMGKWTYNHYNAVQKGIQALLDALKNGQ